MIIVQRPDPRLVASWCREGVSHDHGACGSLWDSSDPREHVAAAVYASDHPENAWCVCPCGNAGHRVTSQSNGGYRA